MALILFMSFFVFTVITSALIYFLVSLVFIVFMYSKTSCRSKMSRFWSLATGFGCLYSRISFLKRLQ